MPLPGDNGSQPWKINNDGLIVGHSIRKYEVTNEAGETEVREMPTAAFWSTDFVDAMIELVAFALNDQPSVFSDARDINQCNEDGIAQIVGIVHEIGPVLWLVDRETLVSTGPIALTPDDMRGWALGINNAGDACGDHGAEPYRVLADGTHEELSIRRNFWADAERHRREPARRRHCLGNRQYGRDLRYVWRPVETGRNACLAEQVHRPLRLAAHP